MKHKTFDWLEEAQEEIYEQTKNMTLEEKVAYWKRQDETFRKWKQELQEQPQLAGPKPA